MEKAELLWSEFDVIQNKIEDLDISEVQQAERNEFEDTYHALVTKARKLSTSQSISGSITCNNVFSVSNALPNVQVEQIAMRPAVKLPNIELPKFDGSYERWIPFRDLFESIIATNTALSPVQKLHYLRSALNGEVLKVITALEITNDNYEVAWNLLKNRFENKRLIVQYLIQTLLDLPAIAKESHVDLRQLADNIA